MTGVSKTNSSTITSDINIYGVNFFLEFLLKYFD